VHEFVYLNLMRLYSHPKYPTMTLFNELTKSYSYIQFATCVSDNNGQCLQTNEKWQEVTGYSEAESLGIGWIRNIHPDDIDRLLTELEQFRTSKQKGIFNYRIIVDGKIKYIQKLSTPVILNNETTYFVCIVTDVTAQKKQEDEIAKQHKLLQSLQEIQIGFLTSENESKVFEDLLAKILDLTECSYGFIGEVVEDDGQKILESHVISNLSWNKETQQLYDPKLEGGGMRLESLDNLFGTAILTGEPILSNDVPNDPRGKGIPTGHPALTNFLGIPFKRDEQVVGMVGIANHKGDFTSEMIAFLEPITATASTLLQARQIKRSKEITERDNAEKAQYLNILLSSLDDIIFELNEELEFTNVWTKEPDKLFIPPAEFLGKPYHMFFPPSFIELTKPVMESVLETGISNGYEYQGFGDLSDRWFSCTDSLVTLTNGRKRLLKQVRDITEIKNSQQAILNAKEEAEKATRIKSEFISVMSHEIRTPMNAIIGFINLLLHETPLPHQIPYLTNLKMSASQLLYLLNNILDYSKIEAGKMQFELAPVSLKDLAASVMTTFSHSAKEKGLSLKTIVDPQIDKKVVTDAFRLNRVVSNLLSNAIKFTEKGEVSFEIKLEHQTPEALTVAMLIRDTGVGIGEENLQYIFEEFTQEHSSITRKYGGTGLGLAISNKLIKEFNSTIEVRSEKGKGSCFSFVLTLPIAKPGDSAHDEKLPSDTGLGDVEVLVVEDNQINALIVQKFITNWGGKSQHASSGAMAIEMLKSQSFDVILMDLQMPDMDGYETTKLIRAFLPDIPVIALTADAMSETKTTVMESGMNDYITKPFNPTELKGILEHYAHKGNIPQQ
jgi:PAS domain S-box-containing protein